MKVDKKQFGTPHISVLIAAHNAAETLSRSVESLFHQTLQDFEVIIINDASEDDTERVIYNFSYDNRVACLSNAENLGLSRSLNRGLEIARGSIIVQLDSDDWLESNALQLISYHFNHTPESVAVYGNTTSQTQTEINLPVPASPEECLGFVAVQAPRAYRKQVLQSINGWSMQDVFLGRYFEDRLLLARMCAVGPVHAIHEPLYNQVKRQQSLSRRNPTRRGRAAASAPRPDHVASRSSRTRKNRGRYRRKRRQRRHRAPYRSRGCVSFGRVQSPKSPHRISPMR